MGLPLRTVLGQLQRHACREQTGALTDAELLRRYLTRRDEAAFESLVWRHGAMVLAVCRRLVRHEQDAEDAFQAVFLTFARAAGRITRRESVGGWLYRVACRVARKARARSARRAAGPLGDLARAGGDPADEAARHELRPLLDEEVGRLPVKYRVPLVLCYLQGRTNEQAARELGWPRGTVATRLARARRLLRARLTRRGVALSAGALARPAEAGPPRVPLVLDTIRASLCFANGGPAADGIVSAPVASLTEGALRTMDRMKRLLMAAALVAAALAVTAAAVAHQSLNERAGSARTREAGATAQDKGQPTQKGPNRLLFYRQGHLTLIGPDGKGEKTVSQDRNEFHPGEARLSPDGKRVAFSVQVERSPVPGFDPRRKLYVRGLDEEEPGTDLGIEGLMFRWSPDGKQLVVTDRVRGDDPKEFKFVTRLVDVATRKQIAVKLPDSQVVTDWSRDGKYFLTSDLADDKERFTSRLHLVSRDDGEDRVLKAAGPMAFNGVLSPDGGKVLYMAPDPERKGKEMRDTVGLFVLDVRAGKVTRVQGQPLNGTSMGYCLSPDGKRIAHTWRLDQGPQEDGQMTESHLIVSDADGGNAVTIASERGDPRGLITLGDPDWR
jgi:RNA polymerase sigma factor (sigma-70 family)